MKRNHSWVNVERFMRRTLLVLLQLYAYSTGPEL
jgi:hypothetical protein